MRSFKHTIQIQTFFVFLACVFITQANAQSIYKPYVESESGDGITALHSSRPLEIKKLSLKKLNFTKFPSEILKFKNLEELDLAGNFITKLPEELGTLTELRSLNLGANNLKELPKELHNLKKLAYLDISYNQIETFPDVITNITSLEILNIGGNKISSLPDEIGNLKDLRMFYCPLNKISRFPKTIGKLTKLTDLQANNNTIRSLPKEIEEMQHLMQLILYNNELTELPLEISKVTSLGKIDVAGNMFNEIPKEINQIQALKTLFLRRKDKQIPAISDDLLAFIRDNQVKTDLGDIELSRLLNELTRKEQDKKRLETSEREKDLAKIATAEKEKELAEQRSKNKDREIELAEVRRRSEGERAALELAQAESKRLNAEKEKETAELERKLDAQRTAKEREATAKEREAATKERAANKEIAKQRDKADKAEAQRRIQEEKVQQTILYAALGILMFAFIFVLYILNSNRKIKQKQVEAELQKAKADKLLLNILPYQVAEELKDKGVTQVRYFENTSILFADVKGFSALASRVTPKELIKELDLTFGKFDDVITQYGLERIKTIGDCYMCVGGVPNPDPANIVYMIASALEIQNWMVEEREKRNGDFWQVRLGVHVGDLVAGVVGKAKFAYDVWGHAVNTASRMESGGEVGRVNITADTYHKIKDYFVCVYRGQIEAKNIGLVDTYFVEGIKPELSINGEGKMPNEIFKKNAKTITNN